jgi:hypothetical protein
MGEPNGLPPNTPTPLFLSYDLAPLPTLTHNAETHGPLRKQESHFVRGCIGV